VLGTPPPTGGLLDRPSLEAAALYALARLRGGLGLRPSLGAPGALAGELVECSELDVAPGEGFRAWEIDALKRTIVDRSLSELSFQISSLSELLERGAGLGEDSKEDSWRRHAAKLEALLRADPPSGAEEAVSSEQVDPALSIVQESGDLASALHAVVTERPGESHFAPEHLAAIYLPMWLPLALPLATGTFKRQPTGGN